jgi:hypothetical protein
MFTKATEIKATEIKATEIKATEIKATEIKATEIKATDLCLEYPTLTYYNIFCNTILSPTEREAHHICWYSDRLVSPQ